MPKPFSLDDHAALYSARDLGELIALAHAINGEAGIWALLRPTDNRGQILLGIGGHEGLDPLPAGQIARIHFPVGDTVGPATTGWAANLLGLLTYQNDWTATTAKLLPLWEAGSLIAVIGSSQTTGESSALIQSVGLAIRRLHQVAEAERDLDGVAFLLARADKSVLLADRSGKIRHGTTAAYGILKQSGASKDVLPPALRVAIEQDQKRSRIGEYQVSLASLPLIEPTTAQALVCIRFFQRAQTGGRRLDLATALKTLTPAERQTYLLLIEGLRTKEIADRLNVSFHTAKHHCAHILGKCGFSDRLALIAKAHSLPEPVTARLAPKQSKNPQVPPLSKVDLPPPPLHRKTSEQV